MNLATGHGSSAEPTQKSRASSTRVDPRPSNAVRGATRGAATSPPSRVSHRASQRSLLPLRAGRSSGGEFGDRGVVGVLGDPEAHPQGFGAGADERDLAGGGFHDSGEGFGGLFLVALPSGHTVSVGQTTTGVKALKPRLVDFFCGAGGMTKGYQRAGFHVTGVDHKPQPNYCGDEFIQADALELMADETFMAQFSAVHASPPCQQWTAYRRRGAGVGDGYPDLIDRTRQLLLDAGLPWVMENVRGSMLDAQIQLCGSMFGLEVRRHRLFESSFPLMSPPCNHSRQRGSFPPATNRANRRKTVEVGVWRIPLETQKRAMGVDWECTLHELSEMVPPAYAQFIGEQLIGASQERNQGRERF